MRHIAKTEENFPTTLASTVRSAVYEGPDMAERILEAHIQEEVHRRVEAYRASMEARENRNMRNGVFLFRKSRGGYQDDEEESEDGSYAPTNDDKYPGHGKRGTFTEADEDGWRTVVKRVRRKRELTDAELERKWRADILHEEENEEEHVDYNGELTEVDQRREFY
jgi:hypothetical protein